MDGSNQTGGARGVEAIANVAINTGASTQVGTVENPLLLFHRCVDSTAPAGRTFEDYRLAWNTFDSAQTIARGVEVDVLTSDVRKINGLTITDNIFFTGASAADSAAAGLFGAGSVGGHGTATLTAVSSTYTWARNLGYGATISTSRYPSPTYNEPTTAGVGFVDYANDDLTLSGGSTYATLGDGGKPMGAPVALVNSITAGVRQT
jgi:hypothetical protein